MKPKDSYHEFDETVVAINRISKKTKGGNQVRFSALVVVGDRKGKVGAGLSKAKDVRGAIEKATDSIRAAKLTARIFLEFMVVILKVARA